MVWYFFGAYNNRTLQGHWEISNFSSHNKKNISLIQQLVKYFSSVKDKILISAGPYLFIFNFVSSNLKTTKVV